MSAQTAIVLAVFCLLALEPQPVWAWCTSTPELMVPKQFWGVHFPNLRIDVWLSLGAESSFLMTGLSLENAEALVRRVIATHNETVGPPYLVYAGRDDSDLVNNEMIANGQQERRLGITVDSYTCERALLPFAPCDFTGPVACQSHGDKELEMEVSKARVTFEPSSQFCDNGVGETWGLGGVSLDASYVLLHELGHALYLNHSNFTVNEPCPGLTDGSTDSAVMFSVAVDGPAGRDWRRDDVEGFRAIYGNEIEDSTLSWLDPAFPANPPELAGEVLCADARTPPAITTAVGANFASQTQFIAFTSADDLVSHLVWDGDEYVAPPGGAVVDASEHGVSFAPVAIAHSDDGVAQPKVFVVWSADENKTGASFNKLRWGMRDIDSPDWTYDYLVTPNFNDNQNSKDVAVGYDPGNRLFVVSSITNFKNPYFSVVDLAGNQGVTTVLGAAVLPPRVYDVGKANCFVDAGISRCVVPYSDSEYDPFDGVFDVFRTGWFDFEVGLLGGVTLVDDTAVSDFSSRGLLDLAMGLEDFRGAVGDRRYELEREPGVGATNTPMLDVAAFPSKDWPLRIGSQRPTANTTSYRFISRRPQVLCGNGVLDCSEECDDGNLDDGDGVLPCVSLRAEKRRRRRASPPQARQTRRVVSPPGRCVRQVQ